MNGHWERRSVLKALLAGSAAAALGHSAAQAQAVDAVTLILRNGKITTLDPARPNASAVAIADGRFVAVGDDGSIMKLADARTQVFDLGGRRVIPGLMDSHTHLIRGGLSYNMEPALGRCPVAR